MACSKMVHNCNERKLQAAGERPQWERTDIKKKHFEGKKREKGRVCGQAEGLSSVWMRVAHGAVEAE